MRAPRVLVVGDLMTDVAVQLSRPIAWGSDARARISVRSGGAAATHTSTLLRATSTSLTVFFATFTSSRLNQLSPRY